MLKCLLFLNFLLVSLFLKAQTEKEFIKKIEVIGSAEIEVVPDEIYISITLKEYMKDKQVKTELSVLEKQLQTAVNQAGIEKGNLMIESIAGIQRYRRGEAKDFLESKSYLLKLKDLAKIDEILNKLDEKGVTNVRIAKISHSNIIQYRKDMKIQALINAKTKAKYLLEAIDEKLGEVLEVNEVEIKETYNLNNNLIRGENSLLSQTRLNYEDVKEQVLDFQKIKVRYEMKATFRIK